MRAVILVGGLGLRLRPLTINYPKALVSFAGRPLVEWQIEALVKIGVDRIILAIFYREELVREFVERMMKKYKVTIICSVEKEALNTAGPLKLAEKLLIDDQNSNLSPSQKQPDNVFFVLNSDIVCPFPLKRMLEFHMSHEGRATILSFETDEPSRYGVIIYEKETGLVKTFVEKPQVFLGNTINAGIYIFNNSILQDIELKSVSMEREVFPALVQQKDLYVTRFDGFWREISQPVDLILCNRIFLTYLEEINRVTIDDFELIVNAGHLKGVNLIHKQAKISSDALVGPFCVVHQGVVVGPGAQVVESILMDDCVVEEGAQVLESVLMFGVKVERYGRVEHHCALAEKATVKENVYIRSEKVEPGQIVSKSTLEIKEKNDLNKSQK